MGFLFYIDSQLVDSPLGDKQLRTQLKRDSNLGGFLITQEVQLEWTYNKSLNTGEVSGYQIIIDAYNQDGFCSELPITIYDEISPLETKLVYTGIIKLSDLEFVLQSDQSACSVICKVEDKSFYSYINNNKSIKVNLISDRTKNKLRITPPEFYDVSFFNSRTGVYGGGLVKGYRIYDVFKFIVAAISDNQVTFQSDYLQSFDKELFLFSGYCIGNPTKEPNPVIQVSFQDLFNEINKLKNISFFIDQTDPGNPVLRIEEAEYFFNQSFMYSFLDIKNLKRSVIKEKLYGQVDVGSNSLAPGANNPSDPNNPYTFNEGISYFGYKKETFYPLGQCNLDITLDLVNSFVISSNAVSDAFIGGSTEYWDSLFIIELDQWDTSLHTGRAAGNNYFQTGPPYFYNSDLNNANKITRHYTSFQSNVVNFFGMGSDGFRASLGQTTTYKPIGTTPGNVLPPYTGSIGVGATVDPVVFADETSPPNYDGNGNYDSLNGKYTIPTDGVYSFNTSLDIETTGLINIYAPLIIQGFQVMLSILHYDPSETIILSQSDKIYNHQFNSTFTDTVSSYFTASIGDIVRVKYKIIFYANTPGSYPAYAENCRLFIQDTSYWECNGTPDHQITLANNVNNYNSILHEFDYHIPENDFRAILQNPIGLFEFEKAGVSLFGWIYSMTHDNWTGATTIKLITSNAITS